MSVISYTSNSALEQFELVPVVFIDLFNKYNITITNSTIYMFLSVITFSTFFILIFNKTYIIPTRLQSLIDMLYHFIRSLLFQFLNVKGNPYFIFVFTLFTFLLVINLIGMIPYSFTPTSHISITFCLSFAIWLAVTYTGVKLQGFHFMTLFFPAGSPVALAPLLVGIEVISYVSRAFSLAIRLFANMMSGHTLLNIIATFTFKMFGTGGTLAVVALAPFALLIILTGLELGIAMLQAYVFTILTCIYFKDALFGH
jgi:ATP synthase subunit 6